MDSSNKLKEDKVLKFIQNYKRHEALWKRNHPLYNRAHKHARIEAYNAIAREMGMTVEGVRKKIKSLRTHYLAEKTKVEKSKTSASGIYIPTVFWYNKMAFLETNTETKRSTDKELKNQEASLNAQSDCEMNESLLSQPSCTSYIETSMTPPHTIKHQYFDESHSKVNASFDNHNESNRNSSIFLSFANTIAKQLEGFSEEDAYQLMADIQVLLSKRKVEAIRKTSSINDQLLCGDKHPCHHETENVTKDESSAKIPFFIKEESIDLESS